MSDRSDQVSLILSQLMEVVEQVKDGSLLLSAGFQIRHPELYQNAIKTFGSWEATLARLVLCVRDKDVIPVTKEEEKESEGSDWSAMLAWPRDKNPAADDPLWCISSTGDLVIMEGHKLPLSREPKTLDWPVSLGTLAQAIHVGLGTDVAVFSRKGLYYGVSKELVPPVENVVTAPSVRQRLELQPEDSVVAVIASHRLRNHNDRLLHVTSQGKAKATEVREYPTSIGKQAREAFLLNEGDWPVAVLVGEEVNGLFCASALGQGIHTSAEEIRTMGRKSVGVNVMKLADDHDAVVSAFLTDGVEQLLVMTAQGYGKRISFREFRKQGRGGSGMQVLRLNPHDRVAAVLPCDEHADVLLTTRLGKIWRLPVQGFYDMGRAARGKRIFDLEPDDAILAVSLLPCAGNLVLSG